MKAHYLSGCRDNPAPPIGLAARFGHLEIVEILLLHGATPFVLDKLGNSPLYTASIAGHPKIVQLLLTLRGPSCPSPPPIEAALTSIESQPGEKMYACLTLLSTATLEEIQTILQNILVNDPIQIYRGPEINLIVSLLNSLRLCVSLGHPVEALKAILKPVVDFPDVVAWIRKRIEDPNVSLEGESALITAVVGNKPLFLKPLLDSGICQLEDRATKTLKTALYIASENGSHGCVEILLSLGASVSAQSSSGRNSLHAAIERDNTHIVKLLTHHCSIPDLIQKNSAGVTPIALAENRGRMKIIKFMLHAYRRLATSGNIPKTGLDDYMTRLLEKHANLL